MPARNGVLLGIPRRHIGPPILQRALAQALRDRFELQGYEVTEELRVDSQRRFRFDLAIVKTGNRAGVAVEFMGATYTRGRHTRGRGFAQDCAKSIYAAAQGWTVLPVSYDLLRDRFEEMLNLIIRAVEVRS